MKAEFPRLAQMAFNILTVPATEADYKHLFSEAADLLEPRRSKLSVLMLAAILCVKSWTQEGFDKVKIEHSKYIHCDSVANITRLLTAIPEDVITAKLRPASDSAPSPL